MFSIESSTVLVFKFKFIILATHRIAMHVYKLVSVYSACVCVLIIFFTISSYVRPLIHHLDRVRQSSGVHRPQIESVQLQIGEEKKIIRIFWLKNTHHYNSRVSVNSPGKSHILGNHVAAYVMVSSTKRCGINSTLSIAIPMPALTIWFCSQLLPLPWELSRRCLESLAIQTTQIEVMW